jgi:tRNA(Ile)-lysidine synthase
VLTPVADPMNDDPRFDRVRVRRLIAAQGIDAAAVAATAMRLAEAADAIDAVATGLLREVDEAGVAWLSADAFASAPAEVRLRALTRLLLAVGGEDYPPRRERLAGLAGAMLSGRRFKRTLAGTVIESRHGRFAFSREAGRNGLPVIRLRPGQSVVWDHRYAVSLTKGAPAGVRVGPQRDGRPALLSRGKRFAIGELPEWAEIRLILADRLARPPLFPDLLADR